MQYRIVYLVIQTSLNHARVELILVLFSQLVGLLELLAVIVFVCVLTCGGY